MLNPHTAVFAELSLTHKPQEQDRNLSFRVTTLRTGETSERAIQLNMSCEWGLMGTLMWGCAAVGSSARVGTVLK